MIHNFHLYQNFLIHLWFHLYLYPKNEFYNHLFLQKQLPRSMISSNTPNDNWLVNFVTFKKL